MELKFQFEKIHDHLTHEKSLEKCKKTQAAIAQLMTSYERSIAQVKELKQASLIAAQLEEARVSTSTAVSVGRLSKLAFVFIPLSFTTSFFGMNVQELGQGTATLQTFFITAVAIGVGSLIPMVPSIFRAISSSGLLENAIISMRLTPYSWEAAFWYFCVYVVFGHDITIAFCGKALRETMTLPRRVL